MLPWRLDRIVKTQRTSPPNPFRLRYEIYVEKMDRYRSISDHDNQVMIEDVDALSRFLIAEDDGQIVGAMRWTWGGDNPFTERHIEQYSLQPFLDRMPAEQLIVMEYYSTTGTFDAGRNL